ncbi:MAG: hotdog domain-containing protein [Acidimicrobiia bacterium]|jgi:predicted thioesterase
MGDISAGRDATVRLVVGERDTAIAFGSGDVPVLATPRILALAEQAAVAAIADQLAPGDTSVGVSAEIRHLQPSPIGSTVEANAAVVSTDERSIAFSFTVRMGGEIVAEGAHRRVVVARERFV